MEKELFSYKEFEMLEESGFVFIDVKLKKDIGDYKKGEHFGRAYISFEDGELFLFREDEQEEPTAQFKLKLQII